MTSPSLTKVMRVRGTDVVGLRTSKFGDGTDPREIPFEEGKPRRRSRSSRKRETRAPSIGFFFVRRGEGGASYLSLATDDKKRNGRRKKTETVSRTGGAACARRRHVERRLTRWPGTASTFYRATSGKKKPRFCVWKFTFHSDSTENNAHVDLSGPRLTWSICRFPQLFGGA